MVPLIIAAGGMAAGAVGGAAGLLTGSGKNERKATPFYDPSGHNGYDPNAKYFGGYDNGLRDYTINMRGRGLEAEQRAAPAANYDLANRWNDQSFQARTAQGNVAGLMYGRATGSVPSIAQMQADRQMQQAQAAQAAQAASARGAAGVAMAQQNAANNTAQAQGAISGQAQINAANERMQAEQNAFGAYSGMRGGDVASQGQAAQQAQFRANQELAARNANDTRAMGYENLTAQAYGQDLSAKMQSQGILSGSYTAADVANQQTAQANANRSGQLWDKTFSSDERTKVMGAPLGPDVYNQQKPDDTGYGNLGTASKLMGSMGGMMGGGAAAEGAGAAAGMMSDTRAKEAAILARGRQEGASMALSRGGANGGATEGNPNAPRAFFDPSRGWIVPGQNDERAVAAADIPASREEDDIDRQVRELPQRRPNDPVVTLSEVRARRRQRELTGQPEPEPKPANDTTQDPYAGMAPGTEDWERTQPKPERAQPWWVSPGGSGSWRDQLFNAAMQYDQKSHPETSNAFSSDDRTKLADAWDQGRASAISDAQRVGFDRVATAAPQIHDQDTGREDVGRGPIDWSRLDPESLDRGEVGVRGASGNATVDTNPVAEANRSMAGQPYTYKPEYTPPHEAPGQPHFGFMTQNLRQSPVASVAVQKDPKTGLDKVDRDRMLQVVAAGVADLQRQQDETRLALKRGGKGR